MTLMRRPERRTSPFRMLDLMFEDPWTRVTDGEPFGAGAPPVDIRETDDSIIVETEMPGIKPEDTEVTLEGRTLSIRGSYAEEREQDGKREHYLLRERRSGSLARTITLPTAVDPDAVTSSFEHGELKIVLPKVAESRARRIPIGPRSGAKQVGSSG
jgi:HSP20 family protein